MDNDINEILKQGTNVLSQDNLNNYFSVSGLPDYNNATEMYIGHIIMTRPSLNFSDANIAALKKTSSLFTYMNNPSTLLLAKHLSLQSKYNYLPIITTRAKNYTVDDVEIKTVEKGGTFYGHTIKYATHSDEHKYGRSFSMDFRNDKFLTIYNMMYIWVMYINFVTKTDIIGPATYYQLYAKLDYAASLYYLVTRRDNRQLVYWEKLVGVYPKKIPSSIFSSNNGPIIEDTINIDFEYGIKSDPNDPAVLADINLASYGTVQTDNRIPISQHQGLFVTDNIMAKYPFITSVVEPKTNEMKFYLDWGN